VAWLSLEGPLVVMATESARAARFVYLSSAAPTILKPPCVLPKRQHGGPVGPPVQRILASRVLMHCDPPEPLPEFLAFPTSADLISQAWR
jgi:hypothetical protein